MKKNIVKKGQVWIEKTTGKKIKIMRKATGNFHWTTDNDHHIHEGTLQKYYILPDPAVGERER